MLDFAIPLDLKSFKPGLEHVKRGLAAVPI
jgi:hypothetical protein